jgi:hypothetical protein
MDNTAEATAIPSYRPREFIEKKQINRYLRILFALTFVELGGFHGGGQNGDWLRRWGA